MKILVTGVAGQLGRMVAAQLDARGHEVLGIDRRKWPDAPRKIRLFQGDIRKRPAEDVFRRHRPEVVIHMGTVTHFSSGSEQRYRINLGGTRVVWNHCAKYGVRQAVFVGRHTYYGAAADAPLYHQEADPPLALSTFPDLADLVAADLYACQALWRTPQMATAVLRLCYSLGPSRQGTLAQFLAGPRVPAVMGFDPLFQFMHERDAAAAIRTAVDGEVHGVFNVAGPQPVPLSLLIRVTGRRRVAIPEPILPALLGKLGLPNLPPGAVNHLKHPVVVADGSFREATGFCHEYDEVETMESFRYA